jgi:hypothetical protein
MCVTVDGWVGPVNAGRIFGTCVSEYRVTCPPPLTMATPRSLRASVRRWAWVLVGALILVTLPAHSAQKSFLAGSDRRNGESADRLIDDNAGIGARWLLQKKGEPGDASGESFFRFASATNKVSAQLSKGGGGRSASSSSKGGSSGGSSSSGSSKGGSSSPRNTKKSGATAQSKSKKSGNADKKQTQKTGAGDKKKTQKVGNADKKKTEKAGAAKKKAAAADKKKSEKAGAAAKKKSKKAGADAKKAANAQKKKSEKAGKDAKKKSQKEGKATSKSSAKSPKEGKGGTRRSRASRRSTRRQLGQKLKAAAKLMATQRCEDEFTSLRSKKVCNGHGHCDVREPPGYTVQRRQRSQRSKKAAKSKSKSSKKSDKKSAKGKSNAVKKTAGKAAAKGNGKSQSKSSKKSSFLEVRARGVPESEEEEAEALVQARVERLAKRYTVSCVCDDGWNGELCEVDMFNTGKACSPLDASCLHATLKPLPPCFGSPSDYGLNDPCADPRRTFLPYVPSDAPDKWPSFRPYPKSLEQQ